MINQDDYNSKSRKDEAVRYALEKMEAPIAYKKSARVDKIAGRNKENVLVRTVHSIFPQKTDSVGEIARKLFLIAAVIVLIGSLAFLCWQLTSIDDSGKRDMEVAEIAGSPIIGVEVDTNYAPPQQIENPIMTEVSEPGTEEPEYIDLTPVVNKPLKINWDKLHAINPDIKAWIKLTGTLINYPVVQGVDNDYYLKHDIDGKESVSGSIFSSYRNKWDGTDDNTILFGHNMIGGTYFSYLVHYVPNDWSSEPLAFYKVHPTIQMATPDGGSQTYKIFAGIVTNTDDKNGEVFQYVSKTRFSDADDFNNFIIDVMDRSWFFTDVDLEYGDEILTMSTCWWPLGRKIDTRWVVFARKVREGESTDVDTTVATRNYGAKLFDYYYKIRGGKWRGSTWDKSKLLSYKREE